MLLEKNLSQTLHDRAWERRSVMEKSPWLGRSSSTDAPIADEVYPVIFSPCQALGVLADSG
jgi:hypothetical protein